jgi:hypothetical protein
MMTIVVVGMMMMVMVVARHICRARSHESLESSLPTHAYMHACLMKPSSGTQNWIRIEMGTEV